MRIILVTFGLAINRDSSVSTKVGCGLKTGEIGVRILAEGGGGLILFSRQRPRPTLGPSLRGSLAVQLPCIKPTFTVTSAQSIPHVPRQQVQVSGQLHATAALLKIK
jgi:hypothetical protein